MGVAKRLRAARGIHGIRFPVTHQRDPLYPRVWTRPSRAPVESAALLNP